MDKKYLVSLKMYDGQLVRFATDTDITKIKPLPNIPEGEMIVVDDNIMFDMLKVEEIEIFETI